MTFLRKGDRALFNGDGLIDVPCRIIEGALGRTDTIDPVDVAYLVRLDGDKYPRRAEAYQLELTERKLGTGAKDDGRR